jgi:hypothetical protein
MNRAVALLSVVMAGCASHQAGTSPPAQDIYVPKPGVQRTTIAIGDSFSPKSDAAAIAAFVLDLAPVDTGGECSVIRTSGSGATIVMASFPRRANSHTQVSLSFDSAGHLVRFSDSRNGWHAPRMPMAKEKLDSVIRADLNATRASSISFDYPLDQALAINRGGAKPTEAIIGSVRAFENMAKLGPPSARIAMVRRLCGV